MIRKQSAGWFLPFVAGFGVGAGLYALKRELDRLVAIMTRPRPDICAGFEARGLHCLSTSGTTCYLLAGDQGYLLIDTGYSAGWPVFEENLARLGIGFEEIKALLLTHGHYDHTGFAAQVLARSGARLIMHRTTLNALGGLEEGLAGIHPLNARVLFKLMLVFPLIARDFTITPVPVDNATIIEDDDDTALREMGFAADILVTPGHAPGSISVLREDGCAFVGDLMMNMPVVEGMAYRPILLTDQDDLLSSWRRLLDSGVQIMYPAHGTPIQREEIVRALGLLDPSHQAHLDLR